MKRLWSECKTCHGRPFAVKQESRRFQRWECQRAELIKGCPEAPEVVDDERFYRAVVEASAACVINSHNAMTLLEDHRWGISTMRQRALLRFDIFWKMTEEYAYLKSVGATVRSIANKLRAQWPAEADAMPYYPAFRARV